jgi:hypothetical protein
MGGFGTDSLPVVHLFYTNVCSPANAQENPRPESLRTRAVAPVPPLVASLTSVQPGIEDTHRIIETVPVADGNESLTAADSALAR